MKEKRGSVAMQNEAITGTSLFGYTYIEDKHVGR